MTNRALKQIAVWQDVDQQTFRQEIQPIGEPAVLKGAVKHWSLVQDNVKQSSQQLIDTLQLSYIGGDVQCATLDRKSHNGRFFYNSAFNGFNFSRSIKSFDRFATELLSFTCESEHALAIQTAKIAEYFPALVPDITLPFFEQESQARFWLGNRSTVAAHFDDADNIACVIHGKRRFTLFPPEQIDNLYIGPLNFTPAGAPISLVDVNEPDLTRYPKFLHALDHALVAELSPGDAIYIPSLWWHNVEALSDVNLLVNFWQGGAINNTHQATPMDSLLFALTTIKSLPAPQRKAWQAFFNYYIFEDHIDHHQHIPEHVRGVLGHLTPEHKHQVSKWLISQLNKNIQ